MVHLEELWCGRFSAPLDPGMTDQSRILDPTFQLIAFIVGYRAMPEARFYSPRVS